MSTKAEAGKAHQALMDQIFEQIDYVTNVLLGMDSGESEKKDFAKEQTQMLKVLINKLQSGDY